MMMVHNNLVNHKHVSPNVLTIDFEQYVYLTKLKFDIKEIKEKRTLYQVVVVTI